MNRIEDLLREEMVKKIKGGKIFYLINVLGYVFWINIFGNKIIFDFLFFGEKGKFINECFKGVFFVYESFFFKDCYFEWVKVFIFDIIFFVFFIFINWLVLN